jgi:signal transduction histidine kinase
MKKQPGKNPSAIPLSQRIPLTAKMVFITFIIGIAAWAFLDNFQTKKIKILMRAQLEERLEQQAYNNRDHFDSYVRAHGKAAKLFAAQKSFIDYVEKMEGKNWLNKSPEDITYHSRPPEWHPRMSVARAFVNVKYVLLIDPLMRTREVYTRGPELSEAFTSPLRLLNLLTHNDIYMTDVEGSPYLISAETLRNPDASVRAILMFVCPLDSDFLLSVYGPPVSSHIVALMRGEPPIVFASSNPDILPEGTPEASLKESYLAMGKSFFDYGISDMLVHLVSFIPTKDAEALGREMLTTERKQRAVEAIILIISFGLIMFYIARRVDVLTKKIVDFAVNKLGQEPQEVHKGDQLMILEQQCNNLSQGILNYMEELEEKRVELERALEDAQAADRAKGEFISNISHELRSPMTGIIGMTEILLDRELDKKQLEQLRMVHDSAKALHVIINDLLDFSRIGAKKLKLKDMNFNLREVLDISTSFFKLKAMEKNLTLNSEIDENVPCKLIGDPVRLRRILTGLVGNAVKFTEKGSISISVELEEQAGDEAMLHFYIIDTGIGISERDMDIIFKPFIQADGSVTRKYGGTGIGLSISSSLVSMMGGKLEAESKLGEGSTFHFTLRFGIQDRAP